MCGRYALGIVSQNQDQRTPPPPVIPVLTEFSVPRLYAINFSSKDYLSMKRQKTTKLARRTISHQVHMD